MNARSVTVAVTPALVPAIALLQNLHDKVMALPDLKSLEHTVHEQLKEVDRLTMELCLVDKIRQSAPALTHEVRCRHCGSGWAVRSAPAAPRYAITVRGRVDYTRPVYRCDQPGCGRERSPVDEQLGLGPKEHYTRLIENKIAWAGTTAASFAQASAQMGHQVELAVSSSEIGRVAEKIGRRAAALADKEVKERGAPACLERPIPTTEQPETVVLEMDGTCVMGRDGGGHEVKCATVFGLDARARTGSPGKERPVLLRRAYCATSRGIRPFGAMVWALANWWGVRSARRVVVIGDGIDWIWNWSRDRLHWTLPDGKIQVPVEIVDFWHAAENLAKARNAIYADPEGSAARAWFDRWRARLRQGAIEALVKELKRRAARAGDERARHELSLRAQYFMGHAHRMRYPEFEAQGLPIGSGAIEGTCKNLIKGRMDGVGMRWDADKGIELMTALRVRLFNERWDELWSQSENIEDAA